MRATPAPSASLCILSARFSACPPEARTMTDPELSRISLQGDELLRALLELDAFRIYRPLEASRRAVDVLSGFFFPSPSKNGVRARHEITGPVGKTSPPAQRVGRSQPRAEAEGRCPGKTRRPHRCGLKGRENPTRQESSRGPSGRNALLPCHPGHRPSASALGSVLSARWAGR